MDLNLDQLLRTFAQEAQDILDALAEAIGQIDGSADPKAAVAAAFRYAHTFKGSAGSMGFQVPRALAHALEDVLAAVREGSVAISPPLLEHLAGAVESLRHTVHAAVAGDEEETEGTRHLEATLRALAMGAALPPPLLGATAPEASGRSGARSVRVELTALDGMLDRCGELTIARARLGALLDDPNATREQLRAAHEDTERVFQSLQDLVLGARMVAVGPFLRRYTREVESLGRSLQKPCQLRIEGEDAEIDLLLLEKLRDVVGHLLRNAVDHGLEAPTARLSAGKSPFGRITLRARREGGLFALSVSDDGAGIDREAVAAKARARGLRVSETPSHAEIEALLFSAGFSTAAKVTEISGRGVGLDVVRRQIADLRGTVELATEPGRGTTFTVRLPLNLAILPTFRVAVADETYLLPLESVVECVDLPASDPHAHDGVLELRGAPLPFLRLRHHFGLAGEPPPRESVVVVHHAHGHTGFAVDTLEGEGQSVIKPLSRLLGRVDGVSGTALLGDGRIGLLLDVSALVRQATARPQPLPSPRTTP